MPNCSAIGCLNSSGRNGITVHRFPKDEKRRKQWAVKVNRCDQRGKLWIPSKTSCAVICEEHFEKDQYEPRRDDKRLKWNAVPTIFQHRKQPKHRKPPLKRTPENSLEPPMAKKQVLNEHAYVSMHPTKDKPDTNVITPTADSTTECPDEPDQEESILSSADEETGMEYAPANVETGMDSLSASNATELSRLQKEIAKLRLEKKLAHTKLCRAKKQLFQQSQHLSRIFNPDQIRHLQNSSFRGLEWGSDTIKEGLQLWFSCGTTGYNILLQKGYPLPSVRTLQKTLQTEKRENFESGILYDVVERLKCNVAVLQEIQPDCVMDLDEISADDDVDS